MAKMIGVNCPNCGATLLDSGVACIRCGHGHSPKIRQLQSQHKEVIRAAVAANKDADEVVETLAEHTKAIGERIQAERN